MGGSVKGKQSPCLKLLKISQYMTKHAEKCRDMHASMLSSCILL